MGLSASARCSPTAASIGACPASKTCSDDVEMRAAWPAACWRKRAQVAKSLACAMGDDIFFAGRAVKVVSEPQSVAILNVGRWPWHKEEDWTLWLDEFEGLQRSR